jgi:hypothetical protein
MCDGEHYLYLRLVKLAVVHPIENNNIMKPMVLSCAAKPTIRAEHLTRNGNTL